MKKIIILYKKNVKENVRHIDKSHAKYLSSLPFEKFQNFKQIWFSVYTLQTIHISANFKPIVYILRSNFWNVAPTFEVLYWTTFRSNNYGQQKNVLFWDILYLRNTESKNSWSLFIL